MSAGPYEIAAHDLRRRGWSPLPLPAGRKAPPPTGFTGYDALPVSGADVQAWLEESRGVGNVAVRTPDGVLGIDVDAYAGKPGAATMSTACELHGPLPPTVRSTSRDDGASGIYFFRVPAGRRWADRVGTAVEVVHHGHRYAVVGPSRHPEGRVYRWLDDQGREVEAPRVEELPELPAAWVSALDCGDVADRPAKAEAPAFEVSAYLSEAPEGEPCRYVARVVQKTCAAMVEGSRHDTARQAVARLVRAADQGHHGVVEALAQVEAALRAQRPLTDPGEFERLVAGAVAIVKAAPTPPEDRGCCGTPLSGLVPTANTASAQERTPAHAGPDLREVVQAARTYQDMPDPGHLLVSMGAAATKSLQDEPAWILLVAPPSSGKTETTRALDAIADERLDDVTAAGLLSWKPGKGGKPSAATGVLARLGTGCRALVVFGDLSTLLASSDRGGRDVTFSILRRVYDGAVQRDLGTAPEALRWDGRVTVVGAVTGAIDAYTAHADALGPRWLYYRIEDRTIAGRRRASRMARRAGLAEARRVLAEAVAAQVRRAAAGVGTVGVPEELADVIEDAALVTCWGRAAVPRSGYGRREVVDVPVVEEPMRLVRQLHTLARGLLALGVEADDVAYLVRRVALDSMPAGRRAVLEVLADGEPLSTAGVARAARIDRQVARFRLEEFEAVGIVRGERAGVEPEDEETDRRRVTWALLGEEGEIAADVLAEHRRALRRWCEKWVPTPQPPQVRGEERDSHGDTSHTSHHLTAQVGPQIHPEVHDAPTRCTRCGGPVSEIRQGAGFTTCATCAGGGDR